MKIKNEISKLMLESKEGWAIVSGISMYPILKNNWRIKIKSVDIADIKVGDIVVFSKRDNLICHRIIDEVAFLNKRYFIQKGDSSIRGGVFKDDDFIGKVISAIDEDGNVVTLDGISFSHSKLSSYIYLWLFLIKGFFFKKKANKYTAYMHQKIWNLLFCKNSKS